MSDTCFCGNWLVQPERGVAEAWEPFHLRYGSVVINIESKVSPVKLTLTASGLVAVNSLTVGEGGAVVCARGKAARVVKVEEGRVARTVDDTGPEKVEVQHWRRDHQIVPPCPSSSAVSRELQYGGNVGIVPIPSGGAACGNDAMTNYNYTAQVCVSVFLFPLFSQPAAGVSLARALNPKPHTQNPKPKTLIVPERVVAHTPDDRP